MAGEAADPPHLTDRLLNTKHQDKDPATNYDVQIGDGMDIVIVGENGKGASREIILSLRLYNFYFWPKMTKKINVFLKIYLNIFEKNVILPNFYQEA